MENTFLEETAPSIKEQYIRSVVGNNYDFSLFYPLLKPHIKMSEIENLILSIAEEEAFPSRQPISAQRSPQIKLYYVALGRVSEYVLLKWKKSNKLIKSGGFFNQCSFFTGVPNQNANHFFETYDFTICHTLALDRFLHKARQSPVFESYHQLRKEIVFSHCIRYIQANCFFCEEKTHTLDLCPRLRPKIEVTELLLRQNRRDPKFKRNGTRN